MYSLNVAVPGRVRELANRLYPELQAFSSIRQDHSILVKRLGNTEDYPSLAHRTRQVVAGTPPIEAAVTGIDYFEAPPNGRAPVVYLIVESPGLDRLHRQLVEQLGAVPELEGDEYTMHITLARGGSQDAADRLAGRSIDPIRWTITELLFWDAHNSRRIGSITLPA